MVYNDLSGHTHLLDEMTTVVFERLVAAPSSEDALASYLAGVFDLPVDTRLQGWLHQALPQLEKLGLIASKRHERTR